MIGIEFIILNGILASAFGFCVPGKLWHKIASGLFIGLVIGFFTRYMLFVPIT